MAEGEGASKTLGECSSVSSVGTENISYPTDEDRKSKRRKYFSERDATKVYLHDQINRWRQLKEQVDVKTDKEVAALLLDHFLHKTDSQFKVSSNSVGILVFWSNFTTIF